MSRKGSWSGAGSGAAGTWTPSSDVTTETNPYAVPVSLQGSGSVALAASQSYDFVTSDDMLLMMPQPVTEDFVLEIGYRYQNRGGEPLCGAGSALRGIARGRMGGRV